MPSTNGHSPKRAILYARVSTDEQAKSGYSLAQQMEALREYATREGYEVLEEVTDPGQSGASLERPGMDQVRDLVAVGGVSVVLAQDRDRFAREPAYHYLLRKEFEEHGTSMRALNDRGDESPEGELTDGILDQVAKFERTKTAERTRRGKLRKAREGKVIATVKPPYGFRYNESRDGLVVYQPEMLGVEKIFRLAAEGCGSFVIQKRLYQENIPSPRGNKNWQRRVIKQLVMSDVYKPHTYEETTELVSAEVVTTLNPAREYGIRWWNCSARKTRQVSESDGNGGRRYRKQSSAIRRDSKEWIAVPIVAYLPRSLVEQARATMATHRSPQRKHLTRGWELRGLVRCGHCGVSMGTHTTRNGERLYHYYRCYCRGDYKRGSCRQENIRAEKLETVVWEFVSDLLKDPKTISAGMERLIVQEQASGSRNPEEELAVWAAKIEECGRLRRAYQDQQAAGLMTMEELREKLGEVEGAREVAQEELEALTDRQRRVQELERDRDALLAHMSGTVPERLDSLAPEERNKLYRMLRLEVTPSAEDYKVSGAFCTTGRSSGDISPKRPPRSSWTAPAASGSGSVGIGSSICSLSMRRNTLSLSLACSFPRPRRYSMGGGLNCYRRHGAGFRTMS